MCFIERILPLFISERAVPSHCPAACAPLLDLSAEPPSPTHNCPSVTPSNQYGRAPTGTTSSYSSGRVGYADPAPRPNDTPPYPSERGSSHREEVAGLVDESWTKKETETRMRETRAQEFRASVQGLPYPVAQRRRCADVATFLSFTFPAAPFGTTVRQSVLFGPHRTAPLGTTSGRRDLVWSAWV